MDLSSSDAIVETMAKAQQADSAEAIVEDNHDSDERAALVSEEFSKSDKSSNSDSLAQDQNRPVHWREPKKGRKIQTTSLLLRRRKNNERGNKRRVSVWKHTHEPLRLRGGGVDPDQKESEEDDTSSIEDEESSSMVMDDKEAAMKVAEIDKEAEAAIREEATSETAKQSEEDDEGMNSKQDKRKQDEDKDEEEASIGIGDDKEAAKVAEFDNKTMTEVDLDKEAMSEAEDETETGAVNGASCEMRDDKDAGRQAGGTKKKTRRQCEKYEDDRWLKEFQESCGDPSEPSEERGLLNVFGGSFQGHPAKSRQGPRSLERPYLWKTWEQDRQMLRPPPLDSPREPNLEYLNMTVDEVVNEDGIEHFDLAKDAYRRTDSQVQSVKKAQRDQRKVAGGIYQCQEDGKDKFYLHIMKGAGKLVGLKLVRYKHLEKPRVEFETFAQMDYERYVQCSSQRYRVNLPEETETGFIWYGHGGNKHPLSSSVYKFCERVDNNTHYSASGCERVTEAPGASQLLCSNKSCGVIFWHLSVMFFQRVKANHFEEAGQEHFALMISKSKEHLLLWTDKDGNQTRWTRLEHSPLYENVQVSAASLERIRYVVTEALLPQCNFSLPAYSPVLTTWEEPQPFKRIPSTCTL